MLPSYGCILVASWRMLTALSASPSTLIARALKDPRCSCELARIEITEQNCGTRRRSWVFSQAVVRVHVADVVVKSGLILCDRGFHLAHHLPDLAGVVVDDRADLQVARRQ